VINVDVSETFASIWDAVVIDVRRPCCDFAGVAEAIMVAVGLRWVRDGGAVIEGIFNAIRVTI
jgi:hypothetical protein